MEGIYESLRDSQHHRVEVFKTLGAEPHFHAQIEILCVTDGAITVTVNGDTERMSAGDICVAGSYDVHSYVCEEGSEGTAILFPLDFLQRYLAVVKDHSISEHFIRNDIIFAEICALIRIFNEQAEINTLFEEGWVNTVLGILLSVLSFEHTSIAGKVSAMREILAYIGTHYEEELSLKTLSKKFGYSPYHFSRLFNSFTNTNLKKYVNSVRLEAAAGKLKNGASVTDAAFDSGFGSLRSFYRDFAERFGESPQRYMRHNLTGDVKLRDK